VDVEVPRLAQPVEFAVDTPDARVVVHGTRFRVQVEPGAAPGSVTQVAVSRGIVSVQAGSKEVWLRAGERWPAPALSEAEADAAAPEDRAAVERGAEPPGLEPEPAAADDRPASPSRRPGARSRALRQPTDHSLASENRAFAAAMAQRKAGQLGRALSELERWIARYPDSVLQQEARLERFRLLARLGRGADAARAARGYLGDYPEGYAREEARDLVLGSP
jgi:TolA-binding protein